MSSAGEFSFAIVAYDEATAILKKVTESLNEFKQALSKANQDVKQYTAEESKSYRDANAIIQDTIQNRLELHRKLGDSFEEQKAKNKENEESNEKVAASIEDVEKALNKTVRSTALGVAGLAVALKALKNFKEQCVDVAVDTQLVANRIKYMATALNTTSTGIANDTTTVNEFVDSLDNLSPAVIKGTYELVENGHNITWVSESYDTLNKMAKMTGNTMAGVANILGGSNKQLLAQYGIQATLVKEQMASIEASKIQLEYQTKYGVAMDRNTALAEARSKVYASEIQAYKEKWWDFTNTYEGALTELNSLRSIFQNSIGKAIATMLTPLIRLTTVVMEFIANNQVLTWLTAIGSMVGIVALTIASASALLGAKFTQILKFVIGLKNGFKSLTSVMSINYWKSVIKVITAEKSRVAALHEEITNVRLGKVEITQKALAERVDAQSTNAAKNSQKRYNDALLMGNKSIVAYIGLTIRKYLGNIKDAVATKVSTVAEKARSIALKASNSETKFGLVLRARTIKLQIEETISNIKNTATKIANTVAEKAHNVASNIGLATRIKNIASTIAETAANVGNTASHVAGTVAMGARTAATTAFGIASGIATAIATAGFTALNFAMGPLLPILLAIAAAVAAVILVVKNWGTIVEWLQGVFETVSTAIGGAIEWIRGLITNVIDTIRSVMEPVVTFVSNVIQDIPNHIGEILNAITWIFPPIRLIMAIIDGIKNAIENGVNPIESIGNSIRQFFAAPLEFVKNIFDKIVKAFSSFVSPIKSLGETIRKFILSPIEAIANVIAGIKDFFGNVINFFGGGGTTDVSSGITSVTASETPTVENTISAQTSKLQGVGAQMFSSASSMQSAAGGMYTTTTNSGNTVTNNNGNSSVTLNITTSGNIDANSVRNIIKEENRVNNLKQSAAFDSLNMG